VEALRFPGNRGLCDLIKSGDCLGIGFKAATMNSESPCPACTRRFQSRPARRCAGVPSRHGDQEPRPEPDQSITLRPNSGDNS
jgi:hypothetical protein